MSEKIKELRKNTKEAQEFFNKRLAYTLGPVELKNFIEKGGVRVVDVRVKSDYQIAHIPGAISIPKDELGENLDKLSKDEEGQWEISISSPLMFFWDGKDLETGTKKYT